MVPEFLTALNCLNYCRSTTMFKSDVCGIEPFDILHIFLARLNQFGIDSNKMQVTCRYYLHHLLVSRYLRTILIIKTSKKCYKVLRHKPGKYCIWPWTSHHHLEQVGFWSKAKITKNFMTAAVAACTKFYIWFEIACAPKFLHWS